MRSFSVGPACLFEVLDGFGTLMVQRTVSILMEAERLCFYLGGLWKNAEVACVPLDWD